MNGQLPFIAGFVLLLTAWLFARRRRQWLLMPSRKQVVRASVISRAVVRIPLLCWLMIGGLALYALTNPKRTVEMTDVTVERRMFVICTDVSASMGGNESKDKKLFRVKRSADELAILREGDVMGLVAFSGNNATAEMARGYARIIMYPTNDVSQVRAAIASISAQMFGGNTAIGDGIFVSTMALIRRSAREAMGDEFDRWLLQASVESLGTDREDLRYAQQVAQAVGEQKGKFVLLFSDGESNVGMEPEKALWFARRIGVRVHYLAFSDRTASVPFPDYHQSEPDYLQAAPTMSEKKRRLVTATLETGGRYLESDDVDAIPSLFRIVHEAEKNKVVLRQSERSIDARYPFYLAMAASLLLWLLVGLIWQRIP